jgi:hypothetical protein
VDQNNYITAKRTGKVHMAIHYNFSTEGNLLVVTASGFDESLEEVQNYSLATIQEAQRGGFTSVLCNEIQLEYRLGTLDTYKAATFVAQQAPKVARVAIVCSEQFMRDAKFWETVAVNRGLEVRVFPDLSAAHSWIDSK